LSPSTRNAFQSSKDISKSMEKLSIHPNSSANLKHSKTKNSQSGAKPPKIGSPSHFNPKMSKTEGYKGLKPMNLHFAASP